MVDIVDISLLVNKLNKVFNNRSNIRLGEYSDGVGDVEVQLSVDTIATHLAKVVAFVGEKQLLNDTAGGFLVWRFCIAELTVDILNGLFRVVGGIFLQRIIDD